MSENGSHSSPPARRAVAEAVATRRRSQLVSGMRGLARPPAAKPAPFDVSMGAGVAVRPNSEEQCEMCGTSIPADHRHLLHISERRIVCACEPCWGMRSGDGDFRPTGSRTVWLPELLIPDDLWAAFQIPIGLAFFMRSTVTECVVAMYPSPAGATESELHFDAWARACELNPILAQMEQDIEGLIVNRMAEPAVYVLAPIDRCYELTGTIKMHWEGISGGSALEAAMEDFFSRLSDEAVPA